MLYVVISHHDTAVHYALWQDMIATMFDKNVKGLPRAYAWLVVVKLTHTTTSHRLTGQYVKQAVLCITVCSRHSPNSFCPQWHLPIKTVLHKDMKNQSWSMKRCTTGHSYPTLTWCRCVSLTFMQCFNLSKPCLWWKRYTYDFWTWIYQGTSAKCSLQCVLKYSNKRIIRNPSQAMQFFLLLSLSCKSCYFCMQNTCLMFAHVYSELSFWMAYWAKWQSVPDYMQQARPPVIYRCTSRLDKQLWSFMLVWQF